MSKAKFKTPKSKAIAEQLKLLLLGIGGAMLTEGAVKTFTLTNNEMINRAAMGLVPVGGAMAYSGPYQKEAMAATFGGALYQSLMLAKNAIKDNMASPIAGEGKHIEFLNNTLGLAGADCGCHNTQNMLGAPALTWYEDFNAREIDYEDVGSQQEYRKVTDGIAM